MTKILFSWKFYFVKLYRQFKFSAWFGEQLQYLDWWIHSSLVLLLISAQSGMIWAPAFTRWSSVLYLGFTWWLSFLYLETNYNIWIDGSTAHWSFCPSLLNLDWSELQPSQGEHLFFIWGETTIYGLMDPQLSSSLHKVSICSLFGDQLQCMDW